MDRNAMENDSGHWLFDSQTTRRMVLAHRGRQDAAVRCVVSDVVWSEVVGLLRWASAGTAGSGALETGVLWRLATGCGALLQRLPSLSDEIAEPWRPAGPVAVPSGPCGQDGVELAARRLTRLLQDPAPVPLRSLAREIDALGEAAIAALAARTTDRPDW